MSPEETIRRIVSLYRVRGLEKTPSEIREVAESLMRKTRCELTEALEELEQDAQRRYSEDNC